jgi:uncharacterized membrane protein YqiK
MTAIITALIAFSAVALGLLAIVSRLYKRVGPAEALVVARAGRDERVHFGGALLLPLVDRAYVVDCSLKTIVRTRAGRRALRCRDGALVDVTATFHVRVSRTAEDVLTVVRMLGAERTRDLPALEVLFGARFDEALSAAFAEVTLVEAARLPLELRDRVIEIVAADLHGYVLDDLALAYLERTAPEPEHSLGVYR